MVFVTSFEASIFGIAIGPPFRSRFATHVHFAFDCHNLGFDIIDNILVAAKNFSAQDRDLIEGTLWLALVV